MKKIFAIILSLLMVLPMCMAVSAEGETVPYDSSWEISATSQLGTSVMKAFDGDLTTNWHTNYTAEGGKILSHDECPHVITVNFGEETEISGWRYHPRKDNEAGTILAYNIYASSDGVAFNKIFTGTFDYAEKTKADFTPSEASWGAYKMKAIKIEVTNSRGGYGTAAEIEFLKGTSGEPIKNGEAFKGEGSSSSQTSASTPAGGELLKNDGSWKFSASSAYGSGNAIEKAFDGVKTTYWHTAYKAEGTKIVSKEECPHIITVDFGKTVEIAGWRYLMRHDNDTGTILAYNLYASSDGVNFTKIHTGKFNRAPGSVKEQTLYEDFFAKTSMKFIKIEVTSSVGGYGTAAEIEFLTGGTVSKEEAEFEGEAKNGIPYLSRKNWDIRVNSTMGSQTIQLAVDGNEKTYWHSKYEAKDGQILSHDNPPYHIDIDFGTEQTISGLTLIPRQDQINGNFIIVNLYVAEKANSEWVLIKEKATFENSTGNKEFFFLSNIKATKMRVEAVGTHGGYGTMAEVYVHSENPGLETVPYEDFAAREEAGTLYPINATGFVAEYMGKNWDNHTPDVIFDGSPKTFWQTEELKVGEDAILLVDLGKVTAVKEIVYTPRQTTDFHGCWLSVDIFASADNENWTPLFEDFKMEKSQASVKFTLPEEIDARYFEFTITDYFAKRVSAAELSFYQLGGHDNDSEKYVLTIGSKEIKYENADGEGTKTIDVAPYIVNGTTLIPLRGLLELMGAEISWNGDNQIIGVKGKDIDITLQIGYKLVFVEDPSYGMVRYTLRTVPVIKDSRTFIPVRFVSEQLGYNVAWNGETGEITITK